MLENSVQALVDASNKLTDAVDQKIGKIDARVEKEATDFAEWRGKVQAKDINGQALYTQTIDLTGLSTDVYYPVWWRMPGNESGESVVNIARLFSRDSEREPFGPGVMHIAGLNLQLEGCGFPWGGDANVLTIKRISQTYRPTARCVRFGMLSIARPVNGVKPLYNGLVNGELTNSPQDSGCYLRGGLTYIVTRTFYDPVSYSRLDSEVKMSEAVQNDWEIAFYVKPRHKDDVALGPEYTENRMAYGFDNDARYALKGA